MGGAPGPMNMPAGPMGGMPMGNPQFHRDTDEYPQGRDFKDEPERPTHIPPRVRVKTTRLEDVEDPTPWPASIYARIGSGIAVVWGILVLATVAALGREAPREAPQQNVAQARPQNVRPQRQPVNSARPRPNRPANTAPPRASVNRPGANSGANSNDRPRDNGTNRNGSGVTPKNPKDSAAETYAEIEAAINEMGVDEFRHSGEFTTDRTDVDITVDGAAMILPMRTWETKSGDTYKAMLHGAPSVDNIPILTDDGQELDFTYEELSSRDHAYLNRFSFEIKQVVARVNALAASGIANASSGPKSAFAEMPKGAAMTPDVRVPFKLLKPVDAAIPEAYRDTSLQRMILSSDRSIAMLIVSRGRGIAQRFWLQLMNVRRGEQMGVFAMPTSAGTPFGITSDDKAVFTFTAPFGSKPAQFDKWTIEGSELVHAFDIPLIEEINNDRRRLSRDRDPDAIGMINDQTVFLIQDNALSLVDLETGQTQYRTEVANNDPPCFSANNRYLAIQPLEGTADGETRDVLIINCDNLELAGSFAAPVLKSLAFSDDGTRLAGLDDENVITVFDATTGEQVSMLPLADRAGSVYWSGDNFLVAINNNRHT